MQKNQQLAISHLVSVIHLPQRGMPVKLIANEDERASLAKAHGLQAVKSFEAQLKVSKWRSEGVKITGTIKSDIVQTCSVTLEPLNAQVDEIVEAVFVPENSRLARPKLDADGEMILDAEGPDAPETFSGDSLDVGAIAEEFFELGIDPYPRKADAALPALTDDDNDEPARVSPFAKLAILKQKQ